MFVMTNLRHVLLGAVSVATFASTAVHAQNAILIETYKIQNHASWRAAFDLDEPMRRAAGMMASYVVRTPADPNFVTVAYEWDTKENAESYTFEAGNCSGANREGEAARPAYRLIELNQ